MKCIEQAGNFIRRNRPLIGANFLFLLIELVFWFLFNDAIKENAPIPTSKIIASIVLLSVACYVFTIHYFPKINIHLIKNNGDIAKPIHVWCDGRIIHSGKHNNFEQITCRLLKRGVYRVYLRAGARELPPQLVNLYEENIKDIAFIYSPEQ